MKTPIYTGIFQSDLDATGYKLVNLPTPTASGDAANKAYVDAHSGGGGGGGTARKFDVMTYGAVGNGTTDDTTAIQAALAAIPSTGGVLYFPAGRYKYTGATLSLSKPITVEGDGGGDYYVADPATLPVTTIDFNSATGTLFDVKVSCCAFKNIGLRNTSGTTPSAGAGILVSGSGGNFDGSRTAYDNVTVRGFYIGIDVRAGTSHRWENCLIAEPILYGLKLRNILVPDGGDHSISNCWFVGAAAYAATSAIRIESGGGVKIVNTKIVGGSVSSLWQNGIDLAVAGSVQTSDLLVANCSIESIAVAGIKGSTTLGSTSMWANIVITGCQFSQHSQFAIYLNPSTDGDFDAVALTGNLGSYVASPSYPMIYCEKCHNVSASGNLMGTNFQFSNLVTFVNCTLASTYIGADARLVPISGGMKLETRNVSTLAWVESARWTNP